MRGKERRKRIRKTDWEGVRGDERRIWVGKGKKRWEVKVEGRGKEWRYGWREEEENCKVGWGKVCKSNKGSSWRKMQKKGDS